MGKNEVQLITDKNLEGKFVALKSPADTTVIAYGDDPCEVSKLASAKGAKEPVIIFVSESDVVCVYRLSKYEL